MKKNLLHSFMEPPHLTRQHERPPSREQEAGVTPLYDETGGGQSPALYGTQARDGEGNSIAEMQIPYERIEDE